MEFDSLEALANHLTQETVGGLVNTKKGLEAAAQLLEETAKAEIGNPAMFSTEAGGFGPWPHLADATEARKAEKEAPLLETGQMRDSITHETKGWEATIGATDPKMAYHEFGTGRVPARPVFGVALYTQLDKIQKLIGNAAVSGLVGGDPIHPSLGYDVEGSAD